MMQGLVSADALHSGIRWKSLELGKMNSHVGFSNFYVCAAGEDWADFAFSSSLARIFFTSSSPIL